MRERLSATPTAITVEARQSAQVQPLAHVAQTGFPNGNEVWNNRKGKRGWQIVMVNLIGTVVLEGPSCSDATTKELLSHGFTGVMVSDRHSAYNHFPLEQHQLCWAKLIKDLMAIAERQDANAEIGAKLLVLPRERLSQWHPWKGVKNH